MAALVGGAIGLGAVVVGCVIWQADDIWEWMLSPVRRALRKGGQ